MDLSSLKAIFQVLIVYRTLLSAVHSHDRSICSCYTFHNQTNLTWENSKIMINCSAKEGYLVSKEIEEEWKLINLKNQNRTSEWYIGLRKKTEKWMSNQSFMIDKWQPNQPSGDGDCVVMAKSYPNKTKGLFNDLNCDKQKMFICEFNQEKSDCNSSKTYCWTYQEGSTPTQKTVILRTTVTKHNPDLVYVVIVLGILLAGGIGFYIYVFYCKKNNTELSQECVEFKKCGFKNRTPRQSEEAATPLEAEPVAETVAETDETYEENQDDWECSIEDVEVTGKYPVEDAATHDYMLPDPSATASTYAGLYSSVDVHRKPEENEDVFKPTIPSPYKKTTAVYATVDKSKKTKQNKPEEVVYAQPSKTRKDNS